ncbi:MAG: trypsin-like serine protease [Silvanigrellales bacterium]|nr:trypsin-like serine protease [Silvanigrellales bacterium]
MKIRSFQSLCFFFGVAIFSFTGFLSCKTRSFAGGSVKVIDGRETDDGEYPFVLKIGAENKEFICTASLIAPNLVLTAAHCIDDFVFKEAGRIYADTSVKMVLSNSFRVPASSTSPLDRHSGAASYSVQVLEIESVSLHPLYEKSLMLGGQGVHRFQPDLALFKLKTPFVGAEPVTVGWSEALNVGDDVEFAGYGCSLEPELV